MANHTQQHVIHEALKSWLDSLVEFLSMLDQLTMPGTADEAQLPAYVAFRDDLALVVHGFLGGRDVDTVDWRGFGASVARCFEVNQTALQDALQADSEAIVTYNECHPKLVVETLEGRGLHVLLASPAAAVEPASDTDDRF